jgi:hypothetical protein
LGVACSRSPQTSFFLRESVQEVWNALDNTGLSHTVLGYHGSGKSVALVQYGLMRDAVDRRFLYVRGFSSMLYVVWWRIQTSRYEYVCLVTDGYSRINSFLTKLLKNAAAQTGSVLAVNTVIVDGFDSRIHDSIHGVMTGFQTIKYIRCISLKSLRTSTNTQCIRWIKDLILPHWIQEEYKQAIRLGCVPVITIAENLTCDQQTDFIDRVVEERMYYAGGNARFLGFGGEEWAQHIITLLHYGIDAVEPLKDFQFTAERGSELAINNVFSYWGSRERDKDY